MMSKENQEVASFNCSLPCLIKYTKPNHRYLMYLFVLSRVSFSSSGLADHSFCLYVLLTLAGGLTTYDD